MGKLPIRPAAQAGQVRPCSGMWTLLHDFNNRLDFCSQYQILRRVAAYIERIILQDEDQKGVFCGVLETNLFVVVERLFGP